MFLHPSTEEILTGDNGDGENSNPDGNEDKSEQPLREQDRFLPIANIAKIMKKAIPDTGKVSTLEIAGIPLNYSYNYLRVFRSPKMPENVFKNVYPNS